MTDFELPHATCSYVEYKARHIAKIYGLCSVDAEDIAQELRLALWKAAPRYDPTRGALLTTFLKRVIDRQSLHLASRLRVRMKRKLRFVSLEKILEKGECPTLVSRRDEVMLLAQRDDYRLLRFAVAAQANSLDRRIGTLWLARDMCPKEIADTLGIPWSAFHGKLKRFLGNLRQTLTHLTTEAFVTGGCL